MENTETVQIGENEKFLADICRRVGGSLNFCDSGDGNVRAFMTGSSSPTLAYEVSTLPKRTREDACVSIIKQLFFPEMAAAVGVPPASSVDELALKLAVEGA